MAGLIGRQVSVPASERELKLFLLWTFGISWGVGLGGSVVFGPAAYLLGVFGPAIAAAWVTKRHEGSLRSLSTQIFHWRLPAWGYAVALGLPLVLVASSFAIVKALGGAWELDDPIAAVAAPLFLVFAVFIAGGPEEIGWRGFALPRLQSRWNALTASLILGAIWAIWHAPLWFMADLSFSDLNYPLYATQCLASSVVYTWLYNNTRGSLLLAVLLHASGNLAAAYLAVSSVYPQLVLTGLWVLVSVALVYRWGPENLAERARVGREDVHERALASRR